MRRLVGLVGLACLLAAPGCKQHKGDRCEIDADCAGGLTCKLSQDPGPPQGTCTDGTGGTGGSGGSGGTSDTGENPPDTAGGADASLESANGDATSDTSGAPSDGAGSDVSGG